MLALDVDLALAARARLERAMQLREILTGGGNEKADPFFAAVLFLLGD